jgi:hypothetical protein
MVISRFGNWLKERNRSDKEKFFWIYFYSFSLYNSTIMRCMMKKTFICKNCNKQNPVNIRLTVPQQYCGDAPCQRQKKTTDAKYRAR